MNHQCKYIAADLEIGNGNLLLPIQKSAAKSYDTADSEINKYGGVISSFTLTPFLCLHGHPYWMPLTQN
jgi:hypothetical protein